MATIVHSNGSKWMGQEPDPIPVLLDVLAREPLDRKFEDYGGFAYSAPDLGMGWVRFFGNFATVSHVFRIDSDDPTVIAPLMDAIKQNMARDDYRSQGRR